SCVGSRHQDDDMLGRRGGRSCAVPLRLSHRRSERPISVTKGYDKMSSQIFQLGEDLLVARLGFGSGQLAGRGTCSARLAAARSQAILRRAVERGATLIGPADNYGPEVVEELIAAALHPYPTGLVIATKGGVVRTGPDAWYHAGRPQQLRTQCEASLR